MGKTNAPPLDGKAIRRARLRLFLTQAEVAEQVARICEAHDIKFDRSNLSYIESGSVKRPSLKVVRALSEVLDLKADEIYAAEGDGGDEAEPDGVAA